MKTKLVVVWLSVLFAAIISIFWYTAWVYAKPTPVPEHYVNVANGSKIVLPSAVTTQYDKPVFLHFFNPDCPCSRFNLMQFSQLAKQYSSDITFIVVPITKEPFTEEEIQEKIGLKLPVVTDTTLAARCGVYSTPQAVIINTDTTLFYRGNYNKSRYCTEAVSSYANIAVENVLQHKPVNITSPFALHAYGCSLPKLITQ